jgi:hypothetical protein
MLTKALLALAIGTLCGVLAATGEEVLSRPPPETPAAQDVRATYREVTWHALRVHPAP